MKTKDFAWAVGAAVGVVLRIAISLAHLWVGLWVLDQFGWLPF